LLKSSVPNPGVYIDPEFPGGGSPPGVEDVTGEFIVVDAIEFDTDPPAPADVRRFEEFGGRATDESLLVAGCGRDPDGDVSIVMVVVGEHREDLVVNEEGGFAVGEFFGGCG
jgi:hypothetical protein